MIQRKLDALRSSVAASSLCLSAAGLTLACVSGSTNEQPPPVFGGRGAQVTEPQEIPLAKASEPKPAGPCAEPAPASDTTLLDDFEDNDNKPFKAFQREAWWYVATDDTAGKVLPAKGKFTAERLPEGEAGVQNQFAAHFSAEDYEDWGVVWGTTLNWVDEGIKCPFNASAFSGLRFRAKGKGSVAVKLSMPDITPPEQGGTCEKKCYDAHTKVIHLTEDWQTHLVPFNRLQQGGWGVEVRFDPKRLLNLSFAVGPKQMPVDFWVDDIEFIPASPKPAVEPTRSAPSAETGPTPPAAPPAPATAAPAPTPPAPRAPVQ